MLGVLLIVVSVVGVWIVVTAARQTESVYSAATTLVPGQRVEPDDLRVVEVGLGTLAAGYLRADDPVDDLIVVRTVDEGELISVTSVGDADQATRTSVVVRSAVDVPGAIGTGDTVEVWSAPVLEPGVFDVPRILIADATVVSVSRDDSMIGGGAAEVELVIPRTEVAATLEAMANGSALSVVPLSGVGG